MEMGAGAWVGELAAFGVVGIIVVALLVTTLVGLFMVAKF